MVTAVHEVAVPGGVSDEARCVTSIGVGDAAVVKVGSVYIVLGRRVEIRERSTHQAAA